MVTHHRQDLNRVHGSQPGVLDLKIDHDLLDHSMGVSFELLIGSAWALVFTGAGSLFTVMLFALLR